MTKGDKPSRMVHERKTTCLIGCSQNSHAVSRGEVLSLASAQALSAWRQSRI